MKLFDLPDEKIRVVQTETGGGFGGKEEYPSMIAGHAALLAWKSGRPGEDDLRPRGGHGGDDQAPSVAHAPPDRGDAATAGCSRWTSTSSSTAARTARCRRSCCRAARSTRRPYFCPNVRVRGRAVATNVPPHGAFRGFGAPQSIFALERHMDRVARRVGMHAGGVAPAQLHPDGPDERGRAGDARAGRHAGAARSRARALATITRSARGSTRRTLGAR